MSFETEIVAPILQETIGELVTGLSEVTRTSWQDSGEFIRDIEKIHEGSSDREAAQMLNLVGEALLGTFNALPREDTPSN